MYDLWTFNSVDLWTFNYYKHYHGHDFRTWFSLRSDHGPMPNALKRVCRLVTKARDNGYRGYRPIRLRRDDRDLKVERRLAEWWERIPEQAINKEPARVLGVDLQDTEGPIGLSGMRGVGSFLATLQLGFHVVRSCMYNDDWTDLTAIYERKNLTIDIR